MANYALLVKNVVDNVIVADSTVLLDKMVSNREITSYINVTGMAVCPGDIHLGGGVFESPTAVPRALLTKEEFFSRLTDEEYGGLIILSRRDDAVGVRISGFLRWLEILGALDVTEERIVAGFQWLVDQGYLTSERRDEILASVT